VGLHDVQIVHTIVGWASNGTRTRPRRTSQNTVFDSPSVPVFDDDLAITVPDDESDPGERRFVSIGTGAKGRVLVVVYSWRRANIRIISARRTEAHERVEYGEKR